MPRKRVKANGTDSVISVVESYLTGSAFEDSDVIGVTERLIRRLRVAILSGALRPGQKLRESELCADYDVSRATVREALRLLESENLVELIPNRGPFVAKLGIKEIDELHDVWALLTGESVYRFTQHSKPGDVEALEKIVDTLREAIEDEDALAQLNATNKIFSYISNKNANRILQEITIRVVSRMMFLRAQSLRHRGWGHLYAEEIGDIVEAIRLRSPEDARDAMRRHVTSACTAAKQVSVTPPESRSRSAIEKPRPSEVTSRTKIRKRARNAG